MIFFYGPAYTPEFNSVENLFSIYKKRLQMKKNDDKFDLIKNTIEIMNNFESTHIRNFFRNSLKAMRDFHDKNF